MNNLFYKIRCFFRSAVPENKDEKEGKKILRSRIASLPPLPPLNDSWTKNRSSLRADILRRDPQTFLSWPYIQYTMFHQSKLQELDELKQKPYWKEWEKSLVESSVGTPRTYPHFNTTSGNLIHQAYSLSQLKDYSHIDFSTLNTIVEFGGGYGSMARLVYNLGFRGTYLIFDLPEFLALQTYYLGLNGIENIVYADTLEKLTEMLASSATVDVCIATWSLSETPLSLRESFMKKLPRIAYFLISYQNSFEEIDNTSYFQKFMRDRKEITWNSYPIEHLPGNNYLVGKRQ